MDEHQAAEYLSETLPEFESEIADHVDTHEELLFHVLMGDLARFYVEEGRHDPHLARRFWMAVDWLAAKGDENVVNAVGVSLIEWFAWGSKEEQRILLDACPLQGSTTLYVVDEFMRTAAHDSSRPVAKGRKSARNSTKRPRRT